MIRRLSCLAALLATSSFAHADAVGEAQALFDQGISDLKAGRTEPACKELAASLAKHDDSGTKGALAVCLTKLGKTASAWQLWRDLADTEPQPGLRADAAKKAAELEPKLPRYVVTVAGAKPDGLVVTVNGGAIDLGVSVPLPVDPGPIAVTAKAPDHDDWAQTFDAVEAKTTQIDVPALVAHPRAKPAGDGARDAMVRIDDSAQRKRHKLALGIGIAGGAVALTGVVFGAIAHSKWSDAQGDCAQAISACPGADFARAQTDFTSASHDATISDVLVIVGVAALAGGAVAWFTAPHPVETDVRFGGVRVTPTLDPRGGTAGLALAGSW